MRRSCPSKPGGETEDGGPRTPIHLVWIGWGHTHTRRLILGVGRIPLRLGPPEGSETEVEGFTHHPGEVHPG